MEVSRQILTLCGRKKKEKRKKRKKRKDIIMTLFYTNVCVLDSIEEL